MAFRELVQGARSVNKENPEVVGFLTGMEPAAKRDQSPVLHFQDQEDNPFAVWSSAVLSRVLLTTDEKAVRPEILNRLVKIEYAGVSKKHKKGQSPAKLYRVFVDDKAVCKNPIPF